MPPDAVAAVVESLQAGGFPNVQAVDERHLVSQPQGGDGQLQPALWPVCHQRDLRPLEPLPRRHPRPV